MLCAQHPRLLGVYGMQLTIPLVPYINTSHDFYFPSFSVLVLHKFRFCFHFPTSIRNGSRRRARWECLKSGCGCQSNFMAR
jgi:hypothetical protein